MNSEIFIQFLKHFEAWCFNDKSICKKKVMFLLDNCSSHRSPITAKFIEKFKINVLFIPAYSPQFAAVELAFNSIKKRLNHFIKRRTIKLSQEESFVRLLRAWDDMDYRRLEAILEKFMSRLSTIWIYLLKMHIHINT